MNIDTALANLSMLLAGSFDPRAPSTNYIYSQLRETLVLVKRNFVLDGCDTPCVAEVLRSSVSEPRRRSTQDSHAWARLVRLFGLMVSNSRPSLLVLSTEIASLLEADGHPGPYGFDQVLVAGDRKVCAAGSVVGVGCGFGEVSDLFEGAKFPAHGVVLFRSGVNGAACSTYAALEAGFTNGPVLDLFGQAFGTSYWGIVD